MSEEIKNFCTEYVLLNTGTEIPKNFTAWCSISAISCVLGRRLWIDMGPFRIYPNMFIVLIAGSGQMRKSTAIKVTRNMLDLLSPGPNLIAQKITTEALIEAMQHSQMEPGKIVLGKKAVGQGFAITDELTNFLNSKTTEGGIVPMLIEFYDCCEVFKYQTKSRGVEKLYDTQLGLLAATTPEELRKAIPEQAIGSGLASRMLFVYETKPEEPVAFPKYTTRQLEAKEYCVRALQRASQLSGPIELSEECIKWCRQCYDTRCFNSPMLDDPHLRGYASRRYIHILKLAISLAVGTTELPILTPRILEKAEYLVELNEVHLQKVIQLVTMNDKGSVINTVLHIIIRHKKISRQDLLRAVSNRLDTRELTEVLETLIKSNQVVCTVHGTTIMYTLKT